MGVQVTCKQCGKQQTVIPARAKTYKFCSYHCRGQWRKENWTGENHPRWQGGDRAKICNHCGKQFSQNPTEAISTFRARKFCCKPCADVGGFRYTGKDHPNYREGSRKRNRRGGQSRWADKVISRDNATCQHCGARDVELHAHHIKPYKDYPELRTDLDNGITLCFRCHWAVHTADDENGVNSGELLTGGAEDNPEPSQSGNILEGATIRGQAYRRWVGKCAECDKLVSRRLSDIKGKRHIYCSKSCATKHRRRVYGSVSYGGNSSTSALRESDDMI